MSEHQPSNFIRTIIDDDLAAGRHTGVVTRFPPEPNGYLHIGHAKSICLNFGLAQDYNGRCHLRFDDTNPTAEKPEFVASIQEDIRWLGFDWGENRFHASEYFPQLYLWAQELIEKGLAFVCEQDEEAMRAARGTVTEPGTRSPWSARPAAESLRLLARMKDGEFEEGRYTLRAKIDMSSPNMKLRDPVIWRILRIAHHHIGEGWNVYPMYDFAHGLSDAIEGITHSICTLEFDNNRAVYDWLVDNCSTPARPHQYEMARLNLANTVMSKRKLRELVEENHVSGWDDPRMPTIAGMRRRGYRPEAIRDFCARIGVAKANSLVDFEKLEFSVRNDLNYVAPRVMTVLDPLKVVITNWEEGRVEELIGSYWPHDVPNEGSRSLPFTRELYIERSDYLDDPPKKFYRLGPGREVRLRYGYVIRCDDVIRDAEGNAIELRCSYDPTTKSGAAPADRKVKGTIHWVSASHGIRCTVRCYDRLFSHETPDTAEGGFLQHMNPDSLSSHPNAFVEPSVADDDPTQRYQFERLGYFWRDPVDSRPEQLVFNRIVALKSSWSKPKVAPSVPPTKKKAPQQQRPTAQRVYTPLSEAERASYERLLASSVAEKDAQLLAGDGQLLAWFDEAVERGASTKRTANLILNDLSAARKDGALPFGGPEIAELAIMLDDGSLSSKLAKKVLAKMLAGDGGPANIAEANGWKTLRDPAVLQEHIDAVLAAHPDQTAAYRGGQERLFGFFVGQVLKATRGQGDPPTVQRLLRDTLSVD